MSKAKIYESNSFGITAALNQINIFPVSVEVVDDEEEKIINAIKNQLKSGIIILSGGVSVGDYDFVASALEKCGVKKIFLFSAWQSLSPKDSISVQIWHG